MTKILLTLTLLVTTQAFANIASELPPSCGTGTSTLIQTQKDGSRYVTLINEAARDLYLKINLLPDSKTIENVGLNNDTQKSINGTYCYRSDRIRIATNEQCAEYDCSIYPHQ